MLKMTQPAKCGTKPWNHLEETSKKMDVMSDFAKWGLKLWALQVKIYIFTWTENKIIGLFKRLATVI